ncbi:MAG TPA: hypothetical protein VHO66_05555 [Ruminiclostridium sp.]|nr:hypothetical protein [Ruminiclostridium sp.]
MKKQSTRKVLFTAVLAVLIAMCMTQVAFAGDAVSNGKRMISDVYMALVGASTAAAGIGVGTGAFMRKFSMGKPDKIEMGGKVIKTSIGGWVLLNGLTTILNFFTPYLK